MSKTMLAPDRPVADRRYGLRSDAMGWTVWDHTFAGPAMFGGETLAGLQRAAASQFLALLNEIYGSSPSERGGLRDRADRDFSRHTLGEGAVGSAEHFWILRPSVLSVARGSVRISFAETQAICKAGQCFVTLIDLPCTVACISGEPADIVCLPIGEGDLVPPKPGFWRDPQPLFWATRPISHDLVSQADCSSASLDTPSFLDAVTRASPLTALCAASDRSGNASRMRNACAHISAHLNKPFAISSEARRLGMSMSSFSHHFKATVGVSPGNYRKMSRIFQAAYQIGQQADGQATRISEIAREVGYRSHRQFSADFRSVWGRTPTQFRDQGLVVLPH
jgi:AraC-like DNA-binding protein